MLSLAHAGVRRGTGPQRPTKAAPSPQQPMSTSLVDSATSCLRAPTPLPGCTRHPCRTVLPKSGGNWYPYAGLATLQTAPQWPNCSSTFTASAPSLSSRLPRQWGHQARPALLCLLSTTLHAKGKGCPAPPISYGEQTLEATTFNFAAVLPHMASNPLFASSSTPPKVSPAEYKASSAAPSQGTSLTAAAPNASRAFAWAQRASASAAQAPSAFISVPQLLLGVDQWLPEESISCVDQRQDSTPSSHHAAARSHNADSGGAATQLPRTAGGNSGAPHSIGSNQAAAGPLGNGITGSAHSSQLSQRLRRI